MKFTVELEREEVCTVLRSVFSDGGIPALRLVGFLMSYSPDDYQTARAKLTEPCREDVWVQMLIDGKSITFVDTEGNEPNAELTLAKAIETLKLEGIVENLMNILIEETYDSDDCYRILQYMLFGKIVYG